jgi:hypothetical protein
MRWVRLNRRIGAWAALFALALQITLSFGHVHLAKFAVSSPSLIGIAAVQAPERSSGPANPDRHTGANDFCTICATIALIASSALPEPARLALPVAGPAASPREFAITLASDEAHFLFQARAPPVAA